MKTWILGTQYDMDKREDIEALCDALDKSGQNDARQIAYALLSVAISEGQKAKAESLKVEELGGDIKVVVDVDKGCVQAVRSNRENVTAHIFDQDHFKSQGAHESDVCNEWTENVEKAYPNDVEWETCSWNDRD